MIELKQLHTDGDARTALVHWLLQLPDDTNQSVAARRLVNYIDTLEPESINTTVKTFRELLMQVANTVPVRGRRSRH
ncbi:MAG: hypothetical protein AAF499_12590 [Pseudomonadota bacterium]